MRRSKAALFLEEILECFARVLRPGGGGSRSLFLHSHPHGIERTLIAFVLPRDPLRDGLAAFEPAGSIEICALAAGVQFEAALRATSGWLGSSWQQSSALGAARDGVRSRHVHRTRAKRILLDRLLTCGLLPFLAAVLVSALTIFAV